jgi:flagellar protein FlbT
MALKLSLKPGERFVVNGAVLQNGDRRAILLLQNKASILREKDIIQPEDVNTPTRHIYFPIMMMPRSLERTLHDEFVASSIHGRDPLHRNSKGMRILSREVMAQDYYKALTRCRKLWLRARVARQCPSRRIKRQREAKVRVRRNIALSPWLRAG